MLDIVADHAKAATQALQEVSLQNDVLTGHAAGAIKAIVVLRSSCPLKITHAQNVIAELRPGWDGSLGYSLYALHLAAEAAGDVRVAFHQTPARTTPQATTPAEQAAFEQALAARPSRFPDGPAFAEWQDEYRRKLTHWLMGPEPARVDPQPALAHHSNHPEFTLHWVQYRSHADRTCKALLSLPRGVSHAPLLVALHGHEATWGAADAGAFAPGHNDDFCAHFAARGWAVLQTPTMDHALQHAGWTLQGEWTHDAIAAIDASLTRDEIDASRLAVCGLSTGAHLAMNVLALDARVRAGVVGCVLSTWNHYQRRFRIPPHCDCGIASQLGGRIEQCDWAALAAPKPVQYHYGLKDDCFTPGADEALLQLDWNNGVLPAAEWQAMWDELRRAYRGQESRLAVHRHGEAHRVDEAAAFAWLQQHVCI